MRAFSFGFSLIELLMALGLLTFLVTVAVPGLSAFLQKSELIAEQQKLQSLLSYARMAAVTQGEHVVICRWDGEGGCTGKTQRPAQIWRTGALVFVDLDQDRELDLPEEKILKIFYFSDTNQISWNRGETLVYEGDGSVYGSSNGTFTISNEVNTYQLVVSRAGRVRRAL
ncbi:GspH/FimT family pseudopilin [Neptuniibacter sp. PT34_22]|uniref:GspH/FimT family pseudopilin n=1 Tax=Neptuniibacter sp. PT34_22 TaxID=3398205 RepID=UPI0039F5AD32